MVLRGERDGFFWLSSSHHRLGDVVDDCPELFAGRSVVVTAFDSGPLILTPEELEAGWEQRGELAIHPPGLDPLRIPCDNFDEWYLFSGPVPDFGVFERFVNWGGFTLASPEVVPPHPTWDLASQHDDAALRSQFWDQWKRLQPSCYIAEGDLLNLVTDSEADLNRVWNALRS